MVFPFSVKYLFRLPFLHIITKILFVHAVTGYPTLSPIRTKEKRTEQTAARLLIHSLHIQGYTAVLLQILHHRDLQILHYRRVALPNYLRHMQARQMHNLARLFR